MKRWNGWGDEQTIYPLPELALEYLSEYLGPGDKHADATLEQVIKSVPTTSIPKLPNLSIDREDRLRHACGQSLPDWINLRSGHIPNFPDGVIYPNSDQEIIDAIEYASSNDFILIPYGGGTSVVRHINPPQSNIPVITIDLSNLNQLIDLNENSQLAMFGAGVKGPEIEQQLRKFGYTLGHFPQSFEFSSLGGWIATRSSGQQSYYYGRIEELFRGGHVESPQGPMDFSPYPASAAGPDLRHLILGSEGRYGIISSAIVAIKPVPEFEAFYGIFFKDWESGVAAVRELVQQNIQLSMIRLSDAQETETTMVLSGKRNLINAAGYGLDKLGYRKQRSLLIIGVTGDRVKGTRARKEAVQLCRRYGGLYTGEFIGKTWQKSRFLAPYLRNSLWEEGYALDTLETAVSWEFVNLVKDKTIEAMIKASQIWNEPILVFGHLSHVYHTGASIYITYLFKRSFDPDENLQRWKDIKSAASATIIQHGGTISHQHGIGHDHAPYLAAEKGNLGLDLLSSIGQSFDPDGLMNPGVMFNSNDKN
jgi:alkyldihydroxyacetonephosphate synthase